VRNAILSVSIALLLSSTGLYAGTPPTFLAAPSYFLKDEPHVVVTADFNGDGFPDVACGTTTGVDVLLGGGTGTLGTAVHSSYSIDDPGPMAVADFNNDGVLDLAVPSMSSSEIIILLGAGDGTFQQFLQYSMPSPAALVTGDFNNDGIPDLAAGSSTELLIFLGNGDGSFQKLPHGRTGALSLAVADFDGDGNLDLALVGRGRDDYAEVLRGQGDGTFAVGSRFVLRGAAFYDLQIGATDLNNDGAPDLAIVEGRLQVALNNGDGTFQPATNYGRTLVGGLVIGDFNHDDNADIAAVNHQGFLNVFFGTGTGTLRAPVLYDAGAVARFATASVASSDLNLDGNLDLVSVVIGPDGFHGFVRVLLGNSSGDFYAARGYSSGGSVLTIADFNGDGIPDAAASYSGSYVNILLGDGRGHLTMKSQVSAFVESLTTGDVNNDHKTDLLVGNELFLGNGDGTFQSGMNVGLNTSGYPVLADLNHDGNLDLIAPGGTVTTVYVALGNGDGTFRTPIGYYARGAGYYVAVGDMNEDGNLDVVVPAGANFDVLFGKGDGTFDPPITVPGAGYPILVVDVNNDGHLDVVLGNEALSVVLGNGDGTFSPPRQFGHVTATNIAEADFNGDGNIDIAATDLNYSNFISIYLGDGTGKFTASVDSPSFCCGYPNQIGVADLNRDGKPDIVANGVEVLLNTTPLAH
jgi:hypothetical protein